MTDHINDLDARAAAGSSRRGFLRALGGLTASLAALPALARAQTETPLRRAGGQYRGDFAAPKLEKVKVAIIGVGARGSGHASQLATIEGVDFVGVCDLVEERAKKAADGVTKRGHSPKVFGGDENAWQKMLAEVRPDTVFIATPWPLHAPMCIGAKYEHPYFKRMGELGKKMGGHGGMDFLMLYRIIECLRLGQPLDQNVYEGCFWSAVGPLSEKSVKEDGMPQAFPDFTRGNWKTAKPLGIIA